MRKIEAAQEMLRRPVRLGVAMQVSFAMIALCAGLAAAHAMAPKATPVAAPVASAATLAPIILSIDWQEQNAGGSQFAEGAHTRNLRL